MLQDEPTTTFSVFDDHMARKEPSRPLRSEKRTTLFRGSLQPATPVLLVTRLLPLPEADNWVEHCLHIVEVVRRDDDHHQGHSSSAL